jgi:hypothetical protein
MCGETSAILVAVAADIFFDGRHLEVPTDVIVRHIPQCIDDYAQAFDWKRSEHSSFIALFGFVSGKKKSGSNLEENCSGTKCICVLSQYQMSILQEWFTLNCMNWFKNIITITNMGSAKREALAKQEILQNLYLKYGKRQERTDYCLLPLAYRMA